MKFRRKGSGTDAAGPERKDEASRAGDSRGDKARRESTGGRAAGFHPDVPQGASDAAPPEMPARAETDVKRLTVGREAVIAGCTNLDCDLLVVEGVVEGAMADGRLLEIAKGGSFKGTVVVDSAVIAGLFEGEIRVKKRLLVRASGRVAGTVRYGQLEIERGGHLGGNVEYDPADRNADLQPVVLSPPAAVDGTAAGG